jgi:hypothetical protein
MKIKIGASLSQGWWTKFHVNDPNKVEFYSKTKKISVLLVSFDIYEIRRFSIQTFPLATSKKKYFLQKISTK